MQLSYDPYILVNCCLNSSTLGCGLEYHTHDTLYPQRTFMVKNKNLKKKKLWACLVSIFVFSKNRVCSLNLVFCVFQNKKNYELNVVSLLSLFLLFFSTENSFQKR